MEPTGAQAKERETLAHLAENGKHLTWNEAKGTTQNRVMWCALVEDQNEEE